MKLYLKQKVFSWKDRFFVKDESEADRYSVEGEILSIGKKLHVYDSSGAKVAFIREKVMSFMPRYFIEINGQLVCEVVKKFTFFKPSYAVEGLSWDLKGDFIAHNYTLTEKNREIMTLRKKMISWGDSYELYIADSQHELLCLCIALAVDCALAAENSNSTVWS